MRLNAALRFRFVRGTSSWSIVDSLNPSDTWSIDPRNMTVDYALVSRVFDSTTGQYVVIAAGIQKFGSLAAGEFVTNAGSLQELARRAPRGWKQKNVEVLIGTKVVGESSGSPYIISAYFW